MPNFRSLKLRLLLSFLAIALVPLFVVVMLIYAQRAGAIREDMSSRLSVIRDLKVRQLAFLVEDMTGDLRSISSNFTVRNAASLLSARGAAAGDPRGNARSYFHAYVAGHGNVDELLLIDVATGKVVLSTNKGSEGEDMAQNLAFVTPLRTKTPYVGTIHFLGKTNMPTMDFSIAVSSPDNRNLPCVMLARVNLQKSLYPLLADHTGLGNTGETFILDRSCTALSKLRWSQDAELRYRLQGPSAQLAARGETGVIEGDDYRGKRVLAAYTFMPQTGWGFVAKQDLAEINGPLQTLLLSIVMLVIVAAFLVYCMAVFTAGKITTPIMEMAAVSQSILAGDMTARNTLQGVDELAYLATSFNVMADSIVSRIDVQQQTAELNKTMIYAGDLREFAEKLLQKLIAVSDATMGAVYFLHEERGRFEPGFTIGIDRSLAATFAADAPEGEFGRALASREITVTSLPEETVFRFKTVFGEAMPREVLTIPVTVDDRVRMVISLGTVGQFSLQTMETLEHSLLVFNTALSRLLANDLVQVMAEDLKQKNRLLQAQTEELTAQAEELQQQSEELQQQTEELHRQNLELDMQKQQVEQSNRMKSEFISNVSHELRTPLNSVIALSRVLIMQAETRLSPQETGYLEIIERNGKHLLALINDILDLSKMEAGRMDVLAEPFPLAGSVEMILEGIDPLAEQKGIEIVRVMPAEPIEMDTDERMVCKVVQNIVSNAVKFTDKGSVTVTVASRGEMAVIEVADTGIGISEDDIPRIFEEFRQVDGSSSRRFDGTGLGLAIASKTVRILGGHISVESRVGVGTKFAITIPRCWHGEQDEFSCPVQLRFPPVGAGRMPVGGTERTGAGGHILLVEDSEAVVVQVKAVLESEGYAVSVARCGEEAIAAVGKSLPDGIILDLMMPGMDGFQVLEAIRNTGETSLVPVLILTAKDLTREELGRLSASSVQQLIQKGAVDRDGLLAKVGAMVENGR